jgi:hypothetical protein
LPRQWSTKVELTITPKRDRPPASSTKWRPCAARARHSSRLSRAPHSRDGSPRSPDTPAAGSVLCGRGSVPLDRSPRIVPSGRSKLHRADQGWLDASTLRCGGLRRRHSTKITSGMVTGLARSHNARLTCAGIVRGERHEQPDEAAWRPGGCKLMNLRRLSWVGLWVSGLIF